MIFFVQNYLLKLKLNNQQKNLLLQIFIKQLLPTIHIYKKVILNRYDSNPFKVLSTPFMRRQVNSLFNQFMNIRSKISNNCKKTLNFATCLNYNMDSYMLKLSQILTDLAKRVYVYQLKTSEYIQRLSKYIDVETIQSKYQEIIPIDIQILNQLINTQHTYTYSKISQNIINAQGQSIQQELDEDVEKISINQVQQQQYYDDSFNTETTTKLNKKRPEHTNFSLTPYTSFQQQIAAMNQMQSINKHVTYKNRPRITISTLTPQPNSHPRRNKHKNGPYKTQTYKIENVNSRQTEMYPFMTNNRVQISLENDIIQQNKRTQELQEKEQRRLRCRQEFQVINNFVQNYLQQRLQYSEDHKSHSIPKKLVLNYYFGWCRQRNRKILIPKQSIIQMALTNELKLAFPGVDVYTNNYRGLYFIKNGQTKTNGDILPSTDSTLNIKQENIQTQENGFNPDDKEVIQ